MNWRRWYISIDLKNFEDLDCCTRPRSSDQAGAGLVSANFEAFVCGSCERRPAILKDGKPEAEVLALITEPKEAAARVEVSCYGFA